MLWITLFLLLIFGSIKTNKSIEMSVSVIIPAYNECKTVGDVVKAVISLDYISEVIVVDDGSDDNTAQIAKDAGAEVIKHFKNRGKGSAIKTGFNESSGDIVVFLDADIQNLSPKQVDSIIKPIITGEADVTKTKFKREAGRVTELTAKPLLNFFFPEITFDQPLSGQFAAKRSFLSRIKLEDDYGVDVGIVLDADVKGMNIKEVDIGKVDHVLSSLHELNVVATEVVRTIVDRANTYGRVTMIDSLGRSIRMGLLGLSMVFLGFFSIFFIRQVPIEVGMAIFLGGVVVAIFYVVQMIRRSINVFNRSDGKFQTLKSFFYMHSPILVSGIILIAMISTLLGAVDFEDGKISIEPTSRNLIIWGPNQNNKSFDIRGPYIIESALENEVNALRMPKEAMDSLGLSYGDSIFIKNQSYSLNQTIPGEENLMRIPVEARTYLGLNIRDVIRDSDIRNIFKNLYAEKNVPVENYSNLTILEGVFIKTSSQNGKNINIYLNDQKVSTTTGIFKNGSYDVYVDGELYKTIYFDDQNPQGSYYIYVEDDIIKIEINGDVMSDLEFAQASEGWFLNFFLRNSIEVNF